MNAKLSPVRQSALAPLMAWAKTNRGLATLGALAFCIITAILMTLILPPLNVMGALGVLSIYIVVFLMVTGIFDMILKRARRNG